jgi:hypothetical protein
MYCGSTNARVHALVVDGHHGKIERIHDLRCQACGKRVSERRGTALYRLKTASWRVSEMMSALAEGLDVGTAVRVFGHAEGTIQRGRGCTPNECASSSFIAWISGISKRIFRSRLGLFWSQFGCRDPVLDQSRPSGGLPGFFSPVSVGTALRSLLVAGDGEKCEPDEWSLSWNTEGRQRPPGPEGPAGSPGQPGTAVLERGP